MLTILYMINSLLKQCDNVFILQAVIDFLSLTPGLDQVQQSQTAQMVRDS
jgi:hypothetical protein